MPDPKHAGLDAALRLWAEALVGRDLAALAQLVDDGLTYVHSTGIVQDREAYLEYVRSGPSFRAVELRDAHVRLRGATAVVNGMLHLTLTRPGEIAETQVTALATQVWVHDGAVWRLMAAQTTRPAALQAK